MVKTCRYCGRPEPDGGFYKHSSITQITRRVCGICSASRVRILNAEMRSRCYIFLGGACGDCGEREHEFLTVEHIFGDGSLERKRLHPDQIKRRILSGELDRSRYKVLCRNCNDSSDLLSRIHTSLSIRNVNRRLKRAETKLQIVALFGGRCACCPVSELQKLTVDHVNNDGNRLDLPRGSTDLYLKILNGTAPASDFQLLCWNCNFSKHLGGGICIHQRRKEQVG